jgi:hypothetical protein
VAFVRLGTSDARNRQPDVGAQQGGCSDRHFTGASRLDERAVEDAKQLRLDARWLGPHSALRF